MQDDVEILGHAELQSRGVHGHFHSSSADEDVAVLESGEAIPEDVQTSYHVTPRIISSSAEWTLSSVSSRSER